MSSVGLRARPATGLIDTIIVCLRRRYWDYFLAALLPILPFIAISVFVSAQTLRYLAWGELAVSGIGIGITACLVSQEFTGQPIALGDAIARSVRRAPGLVAVALLALLAGVSGLVVLIVGALVCIAWTYAAVPAYAIERVGVFAAIGRSSRLANGLVLHVLAVVVPVALGSGIAYYSASYAIREGWLALPNHHLVPVRVVTLLITFMYVATRPIPYVAHAVIYFDLRIRRDGFDIEAMAASLDDAGPGAPAVHPPNAPAAGPV